MRCGRSNSASDYRMPLLHIFNLSIRHSIFPTIWKTAHVTPLYKDGDHSDINNYRPISVLSIPSKVFEGINHNRIYDYVTNCKLFNQRQSGFRKRHSTGTCLIEFLDLIYHNIGEGRLSGVLFLDLKKAFDTVDHLVGISLLSKLNMSPAVLRWFQSYFSP